MEEKINQKRVISIFRGLELEDLLPKIEMLLEYKLTFIEVTLNSPSVFETMEELKTRYKKDINLGAGTVTTTDEVEQVKQLGAEFVISPHVNKEVIQTTKSLGMISIPGVMTPTEIQQANEYGADILKVFPASTLGYDYVRSLRGPFPELIFMATGGINDKNVHQFIKNGYDMVGIGSSLTDNNDKISLIEQLEVYSRI